VKHVGATRDQKMAALERFAGDDTSGTQKRFWEPSNTGIVTPRSRIAAAAATLELPDDFTVVEHDRPQDGMSRSIRLRDRRTGTEVSPTQVGSGVSQVLPIVLESVDSGAGPVLVEQPELHLHPRLQADLADLSIETACRSYEDYEEELLNPRKQWILETHSEALMLRLQRRIREGRLKSDDVCVLYVQPGAEDGSRILRLRLDELGELIDEWPDGFFEESYNEIFGSRRQ
jgi:hypothetical protein